MPNKTNNSCEDILLNVPLVRSQVSAGVWWCLVVSEWCCLVVSGVEFWCVLGVDIDVCIQKHYALLPRLFSKATEMTNGDFHECFLTLFL